MSLQTVAEIITYAAIHGLKLSTDHGKLIVEGNPIPPDFVQAAKAHKGELLEALKRQTVRGSLQQTLKDNPGLIRAVEVIDPDTDPVRVIVAIRNIGSCDLLIRREKWDPWQFLELLNKHGGRAN